MVTNLELIVMLIISGALGGLIGVQVERDKKNNITLPGIRTHIIVATLGCLSYLINTELNMHYLVYAIFASIILFLYHENAYKYVRKNSVYKNTLIYEILIIFSFCNGILIASELLYLAIFLTVFLSFLIYFTQDLHNFTLNLSKEEINSSLYFICISAILLPLLPNKSFDISEFEIMQQILPQILLEGFQTVTALNPYKIWLLVVIISGIGFSSYIAMKILGEKKGLFLTSFLGGIISSTALTSSFSIASKKTPNLSNILASGVILASCIMFVRVFFEVLIMSPSLATKMWAPLLITPLIGILGMYFLLKEKNITLKEKLSLKSPFEIKPALIFSVIFTTVLLFSSLSLFFFSEKGLYITAILSGLVDVDAITLSTAGLHGDQKISELVAMITISLGVISNTIVKAGITYVMGCKELAKKVSIYFGGLLIIYIALLALVIV